MKDGESAGCESPSRHRAWLAFQRYGWLRPRLLTLRLILSTFGFRSSVLAKKISRIQKMIDMTEQDHDVTSDGKSISRKSPASGEASAIQFEDLARGENEVVIEYENQKYRLRVTRNGKLILNK